MSAAERATVFAETMTGTVRLRGEDADRPIRADLTVRCGTLMLPHRTTPARATGRVRIAGRADDTRAAGTLEISPLARRRIHYRITFSLDGRPCVLEGWKSIGLRRPLASLTVLPFTLTREGSPDPVGTGVLRFRTTTALGPFLASMRFPRRDEARAAWAPRSTGTPGRTEVWYTTATDPATGTGLWLHHEVVTPAGSGSPYAHGWAAVFPGKGADPVVHARFGPVPWPPEPSGGFTAAGVEAVPGRLRGTAGPLSWDLTEECGDDGPLYTFPRWSWRRPLLPAAQIVPSPRAHYTGVVRHGPDRLELRRAPGASARIYGHGNARRWAWLHADLGGGDVLEVVAAVSMRPGLDRLPPLVFLRLRKDGRVWPRGGLRSAIGWAGRGRFRADLGLPEWTVTGRAGRRRVTVRVTQHADRTLELGYTDPDGSPATCRNSETADARVVLERRGRGGWRTEAEWTLDGTAHAEVGDR
ncbi:hypothetical protein [Streptomyces tropicalis]|uniref:Uncharacterized protein n=1 Tax=Streptomyces tropicalis TaxID=3034234 RepID=A0ABT6A6J7_9ACTN|nr:hypothetical protein [Streptomyces tropicalis]MDF3300271.1 hypothetical protein [Streptomyces tropicalis]